MGREPCTVCLPSRQKLLKLSRDALAAAGCGHLVWIGARSSGSSVISNHYAQSSSNLAVKKTVNRGPWSVGREPCTVTPPSRQKLLKLSRDALAAGGCGHLIWIGARSSGSSVISNHYAQSYLDITVTKTAKAKTVGREP